MHHAHSSFPKIMNSRTTLRHILKYRYSVARFGDGELDYILNIQRNIGFEHFSTALAKSLNQAFKERHPRLIVCLPYAIINTRGRKPSSKEFWHNYVAERRHDFAKIFDPSYTYGDAQITRPYIAYRHTLHARYVYRQFRRIFSGRDILIVEGAKTRIGVGNDLLTGAKSVRRILVSEKNAYDHYQIIKHHTLKHSSPNDLILAAIGPTATVLAAELSKTRQILDVGHIDIEYEWLRRGVKDKVAIPGKSTNEVVSTAVDDTHAIDQAAMVNYRKQIIEEL